MTEPKLIRFSDPADTSSRDRIRRHYAPVGSNVPTLCVTASIQERSEGRVLYIAVDRWIEEKRYWITTSLPAQLIVELMAMLNALSIEDQLAQVEVTKEIDQ